MIVTLLVFLLILSVLVLIHELGHFLVAKKLGIKVEEFGYGLPPRAWGKKIGETLYSINWLPIGGFVKLYGEDEAGSGKIVLPTQNSKLKTQNKKDDKRAFYSRPVHQRAAVVVAGVVMNAVLAFILFYAFLALSNFKTELPMLFDEYKFVGVNQSTEEDIYINSVSKNSPAEKAGVKSMDKVVSVNGKEIKDAEYFTDQIRHFKGKEMILSWQDTKTGKVLIATIVPRTNPPKGEGALGISFAPVKTAILNYETPMQKTFSGVTHTWNTTLYSLSIFKELIGQSVIKRSAAPIGGAVAGPVGIFKVVELCGQNLNSNEQAKCYLNIAGLLSASLALFNILPIPALDGGRLFFILTEWVSGKKVNQRFEIAAHSIGMAVLLGLILLVTFKDIFQFIIPR